MCVCIHIYVLFTFIFNWRKIALQCCVGFCRSTMQISCNYTYITSLLNLPPVPWSCPSRSSQSTKLGSLYYVVISHQLSILHMAVYICQCYYTHTHTHTHFLFAHTKLLFRCTYFRHFLKFIYFLIEG